VSDFRWESEGRSRRRRQRGAGEGCVGGAAGPVPLTASQGTTRVIVSKVPCIRLPERTPTRFHVPREPTIPNETFSPSTVMFDRGVERPFGAT